MSSSWTKAVTGVLIREKPEGDLRQTEKWGEGLLFEEQISAQVFVTFVKGFRHFGVLSLSTPGLSVTWEHPLCGFVRGGRPL